MDYEERIQQMIKDKGSYQTIRRSKDGTKLLRRDDIEWDNTPDYVETQEFQPFEEDDDFKERAIDEIRYEEYADGQRKLSPQEKKALQYYSKSGYLDLNSDLRRADSDERLYYRDNTRSFRDAMDRAIAKNKTTRPLTLSRSSIQKGNVGDIVSDRAFLSTTYGDGGMWHNPEDKIYDKNNLLESHLGGDTLWRYNIPAGTNYANTGIEDEYVLPRNSKFKVTSIDEDGTINADYLL